MEIKSMEWMYVGNDKRIATLLEKIKKERSDISFTIVAESKRAVSRLLDLQSAPSLLFVDQDLQGIQCKVFIQFIKHHELVGKATIILIGSNFSSYECTQYKKLGVHECLSMNSGIENAIKFVRVWLASNDC
jgi:hypothetical protein